MPGIAAGTWLRKHSSVSSAIRVRRGLLRAALAGDHHVRLQQGAAQVDALDVELVKGPLERARRDVVAPLDRVVGVHQHLGLDDRDDPGLLTQCGVARQRVRIRADTRDRGDPVADGDDRAPLCEARPERAVLLEPPAQPVEPFGHLLAGEAGLVVRAGVHLDSGDRALRREHVPERRAVVRRLPDRLVVEDDAADEVLHVRRGEEQLPVVPPVLLGRLDTDGVEALRDRPGRLVGGEDALVVGDDRACGVV